jgi:thioredoxin reductase (NADPH)
MQSVRRYFHGVLTQSRPNYERHHLFTAEGGIMATAASIRPEHDPNAFPVLSAGQIDRIRPFGTVRETKAGEILFEQGDEVIRFYVLLSGHMEIVQPAREGEGEILVAEHVPGEFTGEVTMISGRRSLVRGRITKAGQVLEVTPEHLRALIQADAELSEILMRAFILRRLALIAHGLGDVVLLGSRHSAGTLRLREFLGRNGHPHSYVDLDTDRTAQELLDRFHISIEDIPVVICHGTHVMRNPSPQRLADCLGFNELPNESQVRDVVVVGAGPAGLAAAVYAASEGLNALVLETNAPGGQAGSSSKIENYLGFPTGISGQELAGRAYTQATKFGAEIVVARSAERLDCDKHPYRIVLDDGHSLSARTIVIASGAQYNRLAVPNLAQYEGAGIYYGATYIEAQLCGGEEVIVVGGGNSAGQAAVFLSQTARKVHMLVRGKCLAASMSRYLIARIEENSNIDLRLNTEIVALAGNGHLEQVTWRDRKTGETETRDIPHIFVMTGAAPHTDWLRGCLALDARGFIKTGRDLTPEELSNWNRGRPPMLLETSLPGVFAVGDVRANNVKRVANAVGEGSIAISFVHQALHEQ